MTAIAIRSVRIFVEKMDCPTEEKLIRKELEPMEGVQTLRFNLLERELTITHQLASDEPLLETLRRLDLGPKLIESPERVQGAGSAETPPTFVSRHGLLGLSGALAVAAEGFAYATESDGSWFVIASAAASVLVGGLPTLKKGLIAIRSLTVNINFLMTVAIAGAMAIGQWPEAAMVTFLFGVAEAIEGASLARARDAVRTLLAITPPIAFVKHGCGWHEVPASSVKAGATVRIRPGERVPVDGRILEGSSAVNQAAITGESVSVDKQPGATVFAGTLNESGLLVVEVTANPGDTTLARIVRAIQEAQSDRAPTQRFVDRFARYYTPAVVAVATGVALVPLVMSSATWGDWIYRALVLLVVACPCALVISTPVTVVSALASAARRGILVKGGAHLEEAHRIRAVALDKTGTLTRGKPALTDVIVMGGGDEANALQIAASVEAGSDHPIAHAVVAAWKQRSSEALTAVRDLHSIAGRGLEARLDGGRFIVGSHQLAEDRNVCSPEVEAALDVLEEAGKTTLIVADETRTLAVFAVSDPAKATSAEAIRSLRELGLSIVMLTGDNERTARSVGRSVGIENVRAALMPDDKVAAMKELLAEHGSVAMVGDGINDAPALASASIGFAMGAAGSDTAIETADVAIMDDDLRKLPEFFALSRRTRAVLKQNIAFAIGVKVVFFALSAAGLATLWMAVFADMGASLLVVANGLRLARRSG